MALKVRSLEDASPATAMAIEAAPWRRRHSRAADGRCAVGIDAEDEKLQEDTPVEASAPEPEDKEKSQPAAPGVAEISTQHSSTKNVGTPPHLSMKEASKGASGTPTAAKTRSSLGGRSSLPGAGPPSCFAEWLEDRPAMLRLGMSAGLGWEFPLSRSEKRELLVLNLAAENRVQSEQLEMQNETIEMLQEMGSPSPSAAPSPSRL